MITSSKQKQQAPFILMAAILSWAAISCGASDDDDAVTTVAEADSEPAKLVFKNDALSQDEYTCGKITIEVQDEDSAAFTLTEDLVVKLTSSDTTGKFYSDSACSEEITEITILNETSSLDAYYKQTDIASSTLTAAESPDSGLSDGTQTVTMATLYLGTFKGACTNNATSSKYEIVTYGIESSGAMTKTTTVYASTDTTCAQNAEHQVKVTGTYALGTPSTTLTNARAIDFTQVKVEITPLQADITSSFISNSYCSKTDWVVNTAFDTTGTACSALNVSALTANTILYDLIQLSSSTLNFGALTTALDGSTAEKRPTSMATTAFTK